MKRLLPSSLFTQVMASVGLALLTAQLVSTFLIYQANEERRENAMLTNAAFQIIHGAERAERRAERQALRIARRGGERRGGEERGGQRRYADQSFLGLPRSLRYTVTDEPPLDLSLSGRQAKKLHYFEGDLREILSDEGISPHQILITVRRAGDDQFLNNLERARPPEPHRKNWGRRRLYTVAIQREAGGKWEATRFIERRDRGAALGAVVFQTLIIFVFLFVILFLVLRRITRPLAQLTQRVNSFTRNPDQVVPLQESGPSDMRQLIMAHNAMEQRIAAMLDEKDVMLGAIGHDLKTPLAALRVRIESVQDDMQRSKMAQSIEDITATLDDILSLARIGRNDTPNEAVDLYALASGIAEEFEDMGEPVQLLEPPADQMRLVTNGQVTWIKRALRNLVSNAVRYGSKAQIAVVQENGWAILRVDDEGPGIPSDEINAMLEPFNRGETSRNRATGGTGLGLTLANAIADQHGGSLKLQNRSEFAEGEIGLRAELRLPLAS